MKCFFKILIAFFVGYLVAVLSFRREVYFHPSTQEYSIKYGIFPFSRTDMLFNSYFSLGFKPTEKIRTRKSYVDTKSMFPFLDIHVTTEGQGYLRAMSVLAHLDSEYHFTEEQKSIISSNFYHFVQQGKASDAKYYALGLKLYLSDDRSLITPVDFAVPDKQLDNHDIDEDSK